MILSGLDSWHLIKRSKNSRLQSFRKLDMLAVVPSRYEYILHMYYVIVPVGYVIVLMMVVPTKQDFWPNIYVLKKSFSHLSVLIYTQKFCISGPTIKEIIYPTDPTMYSAFRVLNAHTAKPWVSWDMYMAMKDIDLALKSFGFRHKFLRYMDCFSIRYKKKSI